jgi:hypothetical protein
MNLSLETPRCGETHRRASVALAGVDMHLSISVFYFTVDDVLSVKDVVLTQ